jgi:hypothetical protein
MTGHISSWKFGNDAVTSSSGDVFPFDGGGVSDGELSVWLQQSAPFGDPGVGAGRVSVQFAVQGGFAVEIRRL